MHIHYIQHVPYEGLGAMADLFKEAGHHVTVTKLYEAPTIMTEKLLSSIDGLVVLGGPMNIYEEATYPWLRDEKLFIKEAIDLGLPVLGICLGAQLIADVLGARVYPGHEKEIGWLPLDVTGCGKWQAVFGASPTVFHWHGDTFELPEGAERMAKSLGCANQGFAYKDQVIALQFHIEMTQAAIATMLDHDAGEVAEAIAREAKYVQTKAQISTEDHYKENLVLLKSVLTQLGWHE